jgi:multiple antibiotic resistance protein
VEQAVHKDHARRLAAFPLAIPLMAGPGAITATLLIAGRADGSAVHLLALLSVIVAVVALCFAVYLSAVRLSRLLGTTANLVFSPLLGVILAALAVQYVVDGVRTVWGT